MGGGGINISLIEYSKNVYYSLGTVREDILTSYMTHRKKNHRASGRDTNLDTKEVEQLVEEVEVEVANSHYHYKTEFRYPMEKEYDLRSNHSIVIEPPQYDNP